MMGYLTGILTDKHQRFGLSLDETDDHIILLKSPRRVIAVFTQSGTETLSILSAADEYLLEIDAQ